MSENSLRKQQETSRNVVGKLIKKANDSLGREHGVQLHYDQIPVPCCRIDINTHIQECNQLFTNVLGSAKRDLLGLPLLELVDRSSYGIMEKILSSSSSTSPESVWLKRKNNSNIIFPAAISSEPLKDIQGTLSGHVIVISDETSSHKRIDVLEKDREALKKKEQLQDEFIAVASHELRTPIQPILGFALLARKGLMSQDEAWDGVLEEARKLQHLANDILDVSRIESGTLKYEMKSEKVNPLLGSIIDSLRNQIQKEGVSIDLIYDEAEAETEIEADRARITQVITNIVSNAIKFTEKGTITVESKPFPQENKVEIRISDPGKGISDEVLPKLFEKFVTKGHGNIENNKGTGLGLYICKAIVKGHNGEISAYNNKNGGATFLIVLPLSQNQKGQVQFR